VTQPRRGDAAQPGRGDPGPDSIARANLLFARALVAGLADGGVRHLCLSPGSRSSPLALAAHAERRISVCVQVDERSAAFLALGIARATRAPVALVCTSGTAAANYLPAIAEANLAGVPLVAVTADRPPELRGTGAAQTIDQLNLYGTHARRFRDLPCPGDAAATVDEGLRAGRDACLAALEGAGGPVHLNAPFREPLLPSPAEAAELFGAWREPASDLALPSLAVPGLPILAALAAKLEKARRPLLLAGPGAVRPEEAASVHALARAAGMPILADIASGLRGSVAPEGVALCAQADLWLRDEALDALAPDFVLRLGGTPTSKTLATWLARHRPPLVAIQPDARRRDPDGLVREVVVGPAGATCAALATVVRGANGEAAWPALLQAMETRARSMLDRVPQEAAAVAVACAALPAEGALFLSSSMPIRWAEMYVPALAADVEVFANRGANGIDGIVSTAIGIARGSGAPTLAVVGDLAFLHDAGGLRSARGLATPLVILLLENGGGGIFSHLPVARHADVFEPYFGTPHGCDLAAVSRAAGIGHVLATTLDEVRELAAQAYASGGVRVIEWRSDRQEAAREQAALTRLAGLREERVAAGGLQWTVRQRGLPGAAPLVLLHGFTGTGASWLPVANALPRRHCLFPDLPGHGATDAPLPPGKWSLERAADALAELLERMGAPRFALAGYSMGGRLALALALRHPQRVAALALVGATPGIADAAERAQRVADDAALADAIERDGIEAFTNRWEANPLFATQAALPDALREAQRAQRLAQDPARLAAALRAFGTGTQPPLHESLAQLRMPVLLVAGEQDAKFAAIARDMAARIPESDLVLVPACGHAVPLERAAECAASIEAFLTRSIDA